MPTIPSTANPDTETTAPDTTTRHGGHARRRRIAIGALGAGLLLLGACTFETDADRAAARRLAERIERDAERRAEGDVDISSISDAAAFVFDVAQLEDIADLEDLDLIGLDDRDGDGLDDDGRVAMRVGEATACLIVEDDAVSFEIGTC